MSIEQPFHAGELAIQERVGERAEAERNGRAISDSIVRGAFRFLAQQPFALAASYGIHDASKGDGSIWASLLVGSPGFAEASNERRLTLDLDQLALSPSDPLLERLEEDDRLGLLFIEPGTRRRIRINGRAQRQDNQLSVDVVESFPNCPKFIQRRHLRTSMTAESPRLQAEAGTQLGFEERSLITRADTFFVASGGSEGQLDISHRGGNPGFIELEGDQLRIPDYPGNHMYNTLGNFHRDPRAGLLFLDFDTGRTLQLIGTAGLEHDVEGSEAVTGGTRRFWTFRPEHWRSFELPVRMEWEFLDASPFNPKESADDPRPNEHR